MSTKQPLTPSRPAALAALEAAASRYDRAAAALAAFDALPGGSPGRSDTACADLVDEELAAASALVEELLRPHGGEGFTAPGGVTSARVDFEPAGAELRGKLYVALPATRLELTSRIVVIAGGRVLRAVAPD